MLTDLLGETSNTLVDNSILPKTKDRVPPLGQTETPKSDIDWKVGQVLSVDVSDDPFAKNKAHIR